MIVSRSLSGLLLILFVLTALVGASAFGQTDAPVHMDLEKGIVNNWLILGPFPNPDPVNPPPGGDYRRGYVTDYLTEWGGESEAALDTSFQVTYKNDDGTTQVATAELAAANTDGKVDLKALYGLGKKAAYGFCYVKSPSAQRLYGYFGSNDGARVWVNGELKVDEYNTVGRGSNIGADLFAFDARPGLNRILVKIEDAGGSGWNFGMAVYDAEGRASHQAETDARQELREFQAAAIVPATGGFIRGEGPLPELQWKDPEHVAMLVGEVPLTTTWYRESRFLWHKGFRQVTEADRPGRYAAIVEGMTPDGIVVRRGLTFYCVPKGWHPTVDALRRYVELLPPAARIRSLAAMDKSVVAERAGVVAGLNGPPDETGTELDAWLLAALDEVDSLDGPLDPAYDPAIINAKWHLALRYANGDLDKPRHRLKTPRKRREPATVLHEGTPEAAGVAPDAQQRIRAICQEWYEATEEPFSVLVARRGVVVIHEAFGATTVDAPMWMASITKCITGQLYCQFEDQGLLVADEPLGQYLPALPVQGDKVITPRHCMTHTTGLTGHGEFGGIRNPYLDNVLANGMAYLTPGQVHIYNGMGSNLLGRAMEAVAGKPVQQLFYEQLFEPLGMRNTSIANLGYECYSTSWDMALFGQLMLNRGSYGDREFCSPEVFERAMPQPLNDFYPGIQQTWGWGMVWMREPADNAGKDGVPADATILSKNVIGHGAASAAILRVDLDNELVITQTRNEAGPQYFEWSHKFFKVIDECLAE